MNKTLIATIITICIIAFCVVGIFYNSIYAEEVGQEDGEEISFSIMLEEIKDSVNEIKDILKESNKADENYYQQSISEQKTMNDNLEEGLGDGQDYSDPVYDNGGQQSSYSQENNIEAADPEEATTEAYEGSTENDNNISNDSVSTENITRQDILDLHSDLQKIMLSIWALAGLYLGTKLISRMFGNG